MNELVIFHKQLGDTVLLEPTLRKIALANGHSVQLLCPSQFAPLIELMPHTHMAKGKGRWMPDRVRAYDWGGRTTRAAAITLCRDKRLLISYPFYIKRRHHWVFNQVTIEPFLDRYISRYYWECTKTENPVNDFSPTRLDMPPEDWKPKFLTPEPYILFNPVSAWKRKCYSVDSWVEVFSALAKSGIARVLMTGGDVDWQRQHCAEIAAKSLMQIEDVSGRTSLRGYLYLISRANHVLCVDGAAAHLARAFGRPCLTVFGPTPRNIWHQEDAINLAVDASNYSAEYRPDTHIIPPIDVVRAFNLLVSGTRL